MDSNENGNSDYTVAHIFTESMLINLYFRNNFNLYKYTILAS